MFKTNSSENLEDTSHTKFSYDNLERKIKSIVLKYLREFINKKLKQIYKNKIGKGIMIKKFLEIKGRQVADAHINYNKEFIKKTLGSILSDTISSRYTSFKQNHNQLLIERLKTDEDENKREYFEKLFNLTFIDCVNHFIGNEKFEVLEGMTLFEEMKSNHKELKKMSINFDDKDYEEYIEVLKDHLERFNSILGRKKGRDRKKIKVNSYNN